MSMVIMMILPRVMMPHARASFWWRTYVKISRGAINEGLCNRSWSVCSFQQEPIHALSPPLSKPCPGGGG